jgi:uroporphyrin-III C-methyltransferase
MNSSKVFICGAGPGDPELISVKGYRLLTKCDVVLYDRLVSKELIGKIPSTIKKIYVGRETGKATSTHQSKTNMLMLSYAQKGKSVLRLKGGDPLIFGRGGEEAEFLRKHDIQFEIIPGITSAIAAPAYAGIPLTHRNYSSSVAFVTGHENERKNHSDVNLKAVATAVDTNCSGFASRWFEHKYKSSHCGERNDERSESNSWNLEHYYEKGCKVQGDFSRSDCSRPCRFLFQSSGVAMSKWSSLRTIPRRGTLQLRENHQHLGNLERQWRIMGGVSSFSSP